jgi:ABC-2 type transport system permease protein
MQASLRPVVITESLGRRSLAAELRALWAIAAREWKIFVRYPSAFVAMVVWPVIFPAAYILTGRALAGPDGSGLAVFTKATGIQDFLGYIAVGTTIWMWQNVVLWNVGLILRQEQWRGTLETNWVSPTRRFFILVGGTSAQAVFMTTFLIVSALEYAFLFRVQFHGSLWNVLLVMLAATPSIYGLGMVFASLVIYAKESDTFVQLVRGLVMVFCGITFPVSVLPVWMQGVSRWLPPTYMIEGVRKASLLNADLQALLPDLIPLVLFGAFWLLAGYLAFHWMERKARRTSGLNHY